MSKQFMVWLSGPSCIEKEAVMHQLAIELHSRSHKIEVLSAPIIVQQASFIPSEDRWSTISFSWVGMLTKLLLRHSVSVVASFVNLPQFLELEVQREGFTVVGVNLDGPPPPVEATEAAVEEYAVSAPDLSFDPTSTAIPEIIRSILRLMADHELIKQDEELVYSTEEEEKIRQRLENLGYL